ncbi:flavohemoglobin expression-modulating QEGLA motif protein [Pseudomonas sp. NW5]|uniref:flavohemoglobin expression-modulating QEGLA motif protein n=1 Tax=Pseudomonas sp. NW5 TaxID=2934934 RepID=UPI00201FE10B|nr:flavohemoglobin expression-modulating QEGLA motif protein [Pseudomonas sp. NW5]MCL7461690.1 flavohemoglobin expression-modulating QEGLA motif protein [Pseudomonas sp. NW5]
MSRKADRQYQQTIRALSDRLVEAQTPIRVLDAIKWDEGVRLRFLAAGGRALPEVGREYYQRRPLSFDADERKQRFQQIERDITRQLGQFSPVGQIMRRMCREYRMVIRMLEARGTADFGLISQELYGSASDAFHAGDPTLADLGLMFSTFLDNIAGRGDLREEARNLSASEAVALLQARLNGVFGEADEPVVRVFESDGILADAAAGADYIKIRADARFSERDLRALEVHEGLVHVATTLNGKNQPICTFLAKGPPSSTITQEGLAILMEVIAFTSYPTRLRKLTNRTRAIHMAEEGADFLQVFGFYRDQGYSAEDSYSNSIRAFRGSTPQGLPFTKDLSYLKGFILTYNYIQLAVRKGRLEMIPLLFCGKTTLEDMRTLRQLVDEGLVVAPRYLPPQFSDLNALSAWMCFSNFLNHLSLDRVEADYANIL